MALRDAGLEIEDGPEGCMDCEASKGGGQSIVWRCVCVGIGQWRSMLARDRDYEAMVQYGGRHG